MTVAQHTAKSNLQKLMRRSCYGNQKIIFLCSMPCYVINFDIKFYLSWREKVNPPPVQTMERKLVKLFRLTRVTAYMSSFFF